MKRTLLIAIAAAAVLASCKPINCDVCVYGPNAAGVMAAYAAAQEGARVVLIGPDPVIGGMTTGGLGRTDIGNKQAITGLSREFYRKLGDHYGTLEAWTFEPKVALKVLQEYASHENITLILNSPLTAVRSSSSKAIKAIKCKGQPAIRAKSYIDCSYEGDLMAAAGVSYVVGREDNSQYGETLDGVQLLKGHQFPDGVDPYKEKGNPSSGLLWGISDGLLGERGSGDRLEQAYNWRICLTDDPDNLIPIEKPSTYDPSKYELLIRLIEAQPQFTADNDFLNKYFIWSPMPGRKTDINNRGAFSTDMIGYSADYPEASWKERRKIIQAHTDYTLGLLWFWGHDERIPEAMRKEILRWGLPKDEYVATNHWSHQLYVREARRMVSDYVATQADCEGKTTIPDGIAMAAYQMDSHNCQRIVIEKNGRKMVSNEGNVEVPATAPYPISYRSIRPKESECTNLLVPVCLSATHIAFGSIRMEPVFMATGQAAGIAAAKAAADGVKVQDVSSEYINSRIRNDDIVVDPDFGTPVIGWNTAQIKPLTPQQKQAALMAEEERIEKFGSIAVDSGWELAFVRKGYGSWLLQLEPGFRRLKSVTYTLPAGLDGRYALYAYRQVKQYINQNASYTVRVGDIYKSVNCDEDSFAGETTSSAWLPLGEYDFTPGEKSLVRMSVRDNGLLVRSDAILIIKR